jgi:hypothetical protein
MKEIINVTIDGKTYRDYKKAYEGLKQNMYAVNFGGGNFYGYEWNFYTKDEVLKEMSKKYKFMCDKFTEQKAREIYLLKKEIKELNEKHNSEK